MGSPEPPRSPSDAELVSGILKHTSPLGSSVPSDGTRPESVLRLALTYLAQEKVAQVDREYQVYIALRALDGLLERVNQLEKALREIKAMGFGEGGGSASGYECAQVAERAMSAAGERPLRDQYRDYIIGRTGDDPLPEPAAGEDANG